MIDVDYIHWPTVLCGPMLRRVEPGLVGVFVALRFRRRVTVTVFACAQDGTPGASVGSATAVTRRLGRRLHVVLVAVTGLQLSPGQLYAYDMRLDVEAPVDAEDAGIAAAGLAALGLLEGELALGYVAGLLPTFRAPVEEANALEFIHASCRKMHGPGKDAMPHLDEVLKGLRTDPFKRPQMLFLTGDQIYADDVAGPLLPVLTAVGHALLGWDTPEQVPFPTGNVSLDGCLPGLRTVVAYAARLTSDAAACHLLGLGEFYAIYLMGWCDVVWPATLPDPSRLYPPEIVASGTARMADLAPLDAPVEIIARCKGYVGDGSAWQAESKALLQVKAGLPAVRRALANVPTYMMLDDHEVTDDWNIDRQWQLDVYSNPIGRRLVSNALFSYAAFQAWGNDPGGMFAGGADGVRLLDALEAIGRLDGSTYNESSPALTSAQTLVRVGMQSFDSGVNWDYSIERTGYRVLVLDTRTHRDATRDGQAALMTETEMERQISAAAPTSKAVHIVLSPAPVIGHPFVERIVQATAGRFGYGAAVDLESWWSAQRPGPFEDLLDRLSALQRVVVLSGDVHYGFSAAMRYWNARPNKVITACITQLVSSSLKNESGMTRFLGGARSQRQHAILSSAEVVADIGASLALSEGGLVATIPVQGVDALTRPSIEEMLVPPAREDTVGWVSGPVTVTRGDGSAKPETGTPALHRMTTRPETVSKPPDWRYRVGFSCDLAQDRGLAVPAPSVRPPNERFIDRKLRMALDWRSAKGHDADRLIVGRNNFARISLFGEPPHLGLRQEFWFRPDYQPMLPYTEHYVDMDPPLATELAPLDPTPASAGLPDLSCWGEQMSLRPADALQDKVAQLNRGAPGAWHFHRLESGWGPINLDFYAVRIDLMPRRLPGDPAGTDRPVGRSEFLQYVRRNLVVRDVIVNSAISEFLPYAAADGVAWAGAPSDALGALIHIGIPGNSGTVMTTASADEAWMFSTLRTPLDGDHPVSGNRRFGIVPSDDGKANYLFTMGTDRCTDQLIAATPAIEAVWLGADQLWKSFQQKGVDLVRSLGGVALVVPPISRRHDWSHVLSGYFRPTMGWKS